MKSNQDLSEIEVEGQKVYFSSSEQMSPIKDNSITLILTSPPYWNVRDYGAQQIGFGQSYQEYIASLNRVWKECIRVLQPNGKIAINVQPLPISSDQSGFDRRIIQDIMFDIEKFMFENGLFLSGMVYWDKSVFINNVSWGSYPKPTNIATNTAFEHIYTFVKPGDTRKFDKASLEKSLLDKDEWRHWAVRMIWDDIIPVIKINQKGENIFGHGAPFPEDIPYRLIRMHTLEGETVLDPFLGSGTTLKVARLTKRKGIGFEINSEFQELIVNRIKEDWTPPRVDAQYKTFSSLEISQIIETSIENSILLAFQEPPINNTKTKEDIAQIKKIVLKKVFIELKKKGIFTPANIQRLKEIFDM